MYALKRWRQRCFPYLSRGKGRFDPLAETTRDPDKLTQLNALLFPHTPRVLRLLLDRQVRWSFVLIASKPLPLFREAGERS